MKDDGQQHILEQNEEGGYYTCSQCCLTWKQPPAGSCPGAKVYQYTAIPWETLATYTQLKRQKLKPTDPQKPDGCYFRLKGKEYIYLYRIDQALPRRTPTEKQREAIAKMRAALKATYTCQRCGWYDDSHGKLRGRHYRHLQISTLKVGDEEQRLCEECREYLIWCHDRHVIEHNMRVWLESQDAPPFLVLDTETVGLPKHEAFQVVEIAAIDKAGTIIFHSLIKPDIAVPEAATAIHGLTDTDLAAAPSFREVWPQLAGLLANYELWTYNAKFDQAAIVRSAQRFKLDVPPQVEQSGRWHCLMQEFARYYGEYMPSRGSDKYQDLYTACAELDVQGSDYHRARGDAFNALGVMRVLAERGGTGEVPEERPIYQGGYYEGEYEG
jgi:DNA polymerase-3 subunit epsilon